MKKLIVFILIFFITPNIASFSHIKHYNKIKLLKYNIYLNNELIGYHIFNFNSKGNITNVKSDAFFKVSKFGLDLISYKSKSEAIYDDNQLIKFSSKTKQNEKNKYVNIKFSDNLFHINGSSFKGKSSKDSIVSSLWNHEIVKKSKQISTISGSVNDYEVKYLGKKQIFIKNKSFKALNFHIYSKDNKKMKEKKINIKIWFDANDLTWLKASYDKLGSWEYILEEIKY